jgi:hypothetical protein
MALRCAPTGVGLPTDEPFSVHVSPVSWAAREYGSSIPTTALANPMENVAAAQLTSSQARLLLNHLPTAWARREAIFSGTILLGYPYLAGCLPLSEA